MSDHDENCDYRHGDEPCNNRLAEYEERIAALQSRVDALEKALREVASEGTKDAPCWCLTRMDDYDQNPRDDSDHDTWCVDAAAALGYQREQVG